MTSVIEVGKSSGLNNPGFPSDTNGKPFRYLLFNLHLSFTNRIASMVCISNPPVLPKEIKNAVAEIRSLIDSTAKGKQ